MEHPSEPGTVRALLLAPRYRLARLFLATLLVLMFLTRLVLLGMHRSALGEAPLAVLHALAVGEAFDLLAALWATLPLVIYLTLLRERWFERKVSRGVLRAGFALALYGAIFVAAAELLFFDEFDGRFNFVAVDYLIFPHEVTVNLWQSYPLPLYLSLMALATGVAVFFLRRPLRRAFEGGTPGGRRAAFLAVYGAVLALLHVTVSPSLAHVSNDRALNEIATSGYCTFFGALLGQDAPYEGLYATLPPAEVFARLEGLLTEPATAPGSFTSGSTTRHVRALVPERKLNVVVVLEESLGSKFSAVLSDREVTVTPHFDSLMAQGTLLTRAYSTGNRTIRALEATTSSLPPLPGISVVRRPASRDLFTLPAVLRANGYSTTFIYGGRALFDGMGAYMRNNGMERVIEQSDYPAGTFTTAWGVADEAIFDKALAEMDSLYATGKPFYTQILSVSNHKPYLYPEGRIAADPQARKRDHAVMYADWALGRFMREAKSHPFFENTLFVLMGDHGARVYGASEIPLPSYEVPVLFYAPGLIPAGERLNTLASLLDIPPTILGLLGIEYDSKFFGQDLFHTDPARGRALMTHNNVVALMRGEELAVLGLQGAAKLYRYDRAAGKATPIAEPDSAGRALLEDAIAYFHGADMLYRSGRYGFAAGKGGVAAVRPLKAPVTPP
jgi:phosphoglycerol transferase MdoB-like AlkP superfamily enzyme